MNPRLSWDAAARALLISAILTLPVAAQEAPNMDAATHPSGGTTYLREQFRFHRYGSGPGTDADRTDRLEAITTLSYGLRHDLAVILAAPLERTSSDAPPGGESSGLSDPELMLKLRVHKRDTAAVDTLRVSLLAGAELPLGRSELSSDSVDPFAGAVATIIRGRHGFNVGARYTINTDGAALNLGGEGGADAIRLDASHLFRLSPADWSESSDAAIYSVVELNTTWETSGDVEPVLSPGLLYEAKRWALELSVRLPVLGNVDERPELDWGLVAGIRVRF